MRIAWAGGVPRDLVWLPAEISGLLAEGVDVEALSLVGEMAGLPVDRLLASLQATGALEWSCAGLTAVPLGAWVPAPVLAGGGGRLSRFAHLRVLDGRWILESALSPWRVFLPEGDAPGLSVEVGLSVEGDAGEFLGALGMLVDGDDRATGWAFHDRLFRSRWRWDTPGIDTSVEGPAPPARREAPTGARIGLPIPAGPEDAEPTLWEAMETRRSHRDWSDAPVSLAALGSVLWRTLRVTEESDGLDDRDRPYRRVQRPVPSGGALGSIDTWLLTRRVTGLDEAWWWYDPFEHALVRVADPTSPGEVSSADHSPVFAVLTARHARGAWKYPAWSHALELRDAGVILYALQVAAGAVGLGLWPLGTGSDRTIAGALGLDLEADAPVGEFALGVVE